MSHEICSDIPGLVIPDYNPEKPKFDWITYNADSDIKKAEEALDSVKKMVTDLRRKYASAAHDVERLRSENWKDEQLLSMQKTVQEAVSDMNRGFPISKEELASIHEWMRNHDTKIHNNPNQYHGASGGGFEFVFYPTGIGTAGDCICSSCKHRSIKEHGENWYKNCKESGGVFEFQRLG